MSPAGEGKTARSRGPKPEGLLELFTSVVPDSGASAPRELGNLVGSAAGLAAAAIAREADRPWLLVTASPGEAQGLAEDLAWLAPGLEVSYLPTVDETGFRQVADRSVAGRRLEVLAELGMRGPRLVVAGLVALTDGILDPEAVENATLTVATGESRDRDELAAALSRAGFERAPLVERPGQFAVRGGIIDVFDLLSAHPVRIELFGDEVESIRSFDLESQRSLAPHTRLRLCVAPRDADDEGPPLFLSLPADQPVMLRDHADVEVAADRVREHRRLEGREFEEAELAEFLARAPLHLERLPVDPAAGRDLPVGGIEAQGRDMKGAIATLDLLSGNDRRVLVAFATEAERDRFWRAVDEEAGELLATSLRARPIRSEVGSFHRGFRHLAAGVVAVNHRELFDVRFERRARSAPAEARVGRPIDDFVDLAEGDYVVHAAHGIGRFVGMQQVEKAGETQEFMLLEYRDDVLLYVPVSKADLVQKYIGAKGDEGPRLAKVGGRSWSRKKEEVFRAVADLAAEMLETQAAREKGEGHAFPPDTPWQHEFEACFPYEETPDQLSAIEAIRTDMESPRPMDRLLCGDVGYGKTEVAMRAAFKAAMSGRQTAIMVPTTVLAEQHLTTFRERMSDFPVRIEALTRFRTKREQDEIVVGVVEGAVDIVIGTHRLLSKDVVFRDLGLVVIDEEQRFGVAHKERLRSLRRTVDILTLTATPIPRTLHLSLLGIRDISSLTQPPRGRQPVQTKIVRFSEDLVRGAVLHELERQGQCFFVHNRVKSIERIRKELAAIAPEARSIVIHGQMKPEEIEQNLIAFVRREADLLLATTIIESGIDIPNANTIFIDRPDMYGLADLHQLRGRVGRQREKAYAYLLVRPDVILTNDAEKRLRAIEEFDELGSGFRIAMRDLEIRGAGNILGAEQHGHIAAVGYDMYCRLLEQAVRKLKHERFVLPDEVALDFDFEAYLPKDYVAEPKVKLELYRKLGRAKRPEEFTEILDEMRDRFGAPPRLALDFVEVCRIRALAEEIGLHRIALTENGVLVRPRDLKDARRRAAVTGAEARVIQDRDLLLVPRGPIESPGGLLALLEAALVPERPLPPRRRGGRRRGAGAGRPPA
ncbi:MAG: transcription-repair coupling factor [Planctomycetota bacterium]